MAVQIQYTARAQTDGLGTANAQAVENADYVVDPPATVALLPLAYLVNHGYVKEVEV